ncbi:MAG TPA: hypothetical protein V6C95_01665 [Coleofasciculaceae cyanobacterium]
MITPILSLPRIRQSSVVSRHWLVVSCQWRWVENPSSSVAAIGSVTEPLNICNN